MLISQVLLQWLILSIAHSINQISSEVNKLPLYKNGTKVIILAMASA